MAEVIPFPIIPRLRPSGDNERLQRARAAMEASSYFAICADEAKDCADIGDYNGAVAQVENLLAFELDDNAPPALRHKQMDLALFLIEMIIAARKDRRRVSEPPRLEFDLSRRD